MLADKMVELDIVDAVSHETIRRTLKKMNLNLDFCSSLISLYPSFGGLNTVKYRFCRKFAFLRPNVKVVCRKINDL
jgi:hypothetical protein